MISSVLFNDNVTTINDDERSFICDRGFGKPKTNEEKIDRIFHSRLFELSSNLTISNIFIFSKIFIDSFLLNQSFALIRKSTIDIFSYWLCMWYLNTYIHTWSQKINRRNRRPSQRKQKKYRINFILMQCHFKINVQILIFSLSNIPLVYLIIK